MRHEGGEAEEEGGLEVHKPLQEGGFTPLSAFETDVLSVLIRNSVENAKLMGLLDLPESLSVAEVGVLFGVSRKTVNNWILQGAFPALRVGQRKWSVPTELALAMFCQAAVVNRLPRYSR